MCYRLFLCVSEVCVAEALVFISLSSRHAPAGAVIHFTQVRENANFGANPACALSVVLLSVHF